MRRSGAVLSAAAMLAAIFAAAPVRAPAAGAQTGISVISEDARNEFPAGVSFDISLASAMAPKEARLVYKVAPDGTGAAAVADCTGAGTVTCTYTLTSGRGIFIIPGAEITYHWEVQAGGGGTASTEDRLYVHEDTRFIFQMLEQDNITLYYHAGSASQAQAVLSAAADTIAKVGALEQTQVTFPVKVFLYSTADEMQPAIAPGGQGRGVQVLGEVVYSDTAMVSADVATLDITRHEVAHIVTREATKGPYDVPGWLNEGISVYSQARPLEGHDAALQAAIRADRVLSMRELNSSATGSSSSTVGLYYGQSGSIVKYLVDTYGADKFALLLRTFKDGSTPDKAFQAAYGLDQLGVENGWRASVGLAARTASATATPGATEQARSNATPAGRATAAPSQTTSSGGGSTLTIAIIVALAVLVLAAAGGAIWVVRRRVG